MHESVTGTPTDQRMEKPVLRIVTCIESHCQTDSSEEISMTAEHT